VEESLELFCTFFLNTVQTSDHILVTLKGHECMRVPYRSVGYGLQTVKMGVQYSLWGGSVLNLGTERHRKQYFADIDQFRLPGAPSF
jgi:multidrug transporter EmrE-like cation transporter